MTMWHGAGGWSWMVVLMLILAVGLVVLARWVFRGLRTGPGSEGEQRSSLVEADRALAERFTTGEIDDDEFRRRHLLLHPVRT